MTEIIRKAKRSGSGDTTFDHHANINLTHLNPNKTKDQYKPAYRHASDVNINALSL
jgi:hypothetical protein